MICIFFVRQAGLKPTLAYTAAAPGEDWADFPFFQYLAALNGNFRSHCVKLAGALHAGSGKALTYLNDQLHAPSPLDRALLGADGAAAQPDSERRTAASFSEAADGSRSTATFAQETTTVDGQGRAAVVQQVVQQATVTITLEDYNALRAKMDEIESRIAAADSHTAGLRTETNTLRARVEDAESTSEAAKNKAGAAHDAANRARQIALQHDHTLTALRKQNDQFTQNIAKHEGSIRTAMKLSNSAVRTASDNNGLLEKLQEAPGSSRATSFSATRRGATRFGVSCATTRRGARRCRPSRRW